MQRLREDKGRSDRRGKEKKAQEKLSDECETFGNQRLLAPYYEQIICLCGFVWLSERQRERQTGKKRERAEFV